MPTPQSPQETSASPRGADRRRTELLDFVDQAGYASVSSLAEHFAVTEMTVRRDVRQMAEAGLLRRVHGGASRLSTPSGTPFDERQGAQAAQKDAVARTAAGLLAPTTVIALDSGTTVADVPAHLDETLPGLTVITHSVPVMAALARRTDMTVIGLGGQLHPGTQSFSGPTTRAAIADLTIDTLLLSASGVTSEGLHCGTPHDAETKQALIARANHVVLLVDSRKIGSTAAVRVASLTAVDTLVTDVDLTAEQEQYLRTAAPELRIVRAHP